MVDDAAYVRQVIRFAHTSENLLVDATSLALPQPVGREWAWGSATGRGVTACIIDSGIEAEHPAVGGRVRSYRVEPDSEPAEWKVSTDDAGDVAGHGTACAGIIRTLAPECELVSIRVLGRELQGNGAALIAGLEWAVRQQFNLINLSLSTRSSRFRERLHEIAEEAYFSGSTLISSAHNMPIASYPWKFSSVISVGSHSFSDLEYFELNPYPPVDFYASGVNVDVAWRGGGRKRISGNSFATPILTGLCARILELHPKFRVSQLRTVLANVANNIT